MLAECCGRFSKLTSKRISFENGKQNKIKNGGFHLAKNGKQAL